MPQAFNLQASTADYLEAWFITDLKSLPIGRVADIDMVENNITSLKLPSLRAKSQLSFFPAEASGCDSNDMGEVLDMMETPITLHRFRGTYKLCPSKFPGTVYERYFRGGADNGDIQGTELGDFFLEQISVNLKLAANTLMYWSNPASTISDYNRSFTGLYPLLLANSSATPSATQALRIPVTQNTQLASGDAIKLLQDAIDGQDELLAEEVDKVFLLNRQLYDAVRRDLQAGTINSSVYPETILDGRRFFNYEGIDVEVDFSATLHAQTTGFAGITTANKFVYLGVLIHRKNFVVRTGVNNGDTISNNYVPHENKTYSRSGFNLGTIMRDYKYAVLVA